MDELIKPEQINFQELDERTTTLQIILLPGQAVHTDIQHILYCSGNLSVRENSSSLWQKLFSHTPGLKYTVKNRKGGTEFVGLSRSTGRFLSLNPQLLEDSLVVDKTYLLAYTPSAKAQAPEPQPLLKKSEWCELKNNGLVFLQGPSNFIEKKLAKNEELELGQNQLVAYTKSVSFQESSVFSAFRHKSRPYVKLRGPGWVFLNSLPQAAVLSFSKESALLLYFLSVVFLMLVLWTEID